MAKRKSIYSALSLKTETNAVGVSALFIVKIK